MTSVMAILRSVFLYAHKGASCRNKENSLFLQHELHLELHPCCMIVFVVFSLHCQFANAEFLPVRLTTCTSLCFEIFSVANRHVEVDFKARFWVMG